MVVHTTDAERHIPYDLWQKGRRVELSVANLFTHLNAIVVRELDNAYYADLYPAHQQLVARHEMQRGERQTIEFILRAVFGLDPLAAGDPARWVEFLIHKHYSARTLPPALEEYVAERLLPLAGQVGLRREFLTDGKAFYAWLGSQWAAYVASRPVQERRRPWTSAIHDCGLCSDICSPRAWSHERRCPPACRPKRLGWRPDLRSAACRLARHIKDETAGHGLHAQGAARPFLQAGGGGFARRSHRPARLAQPGDRVGRGRLCGQQPARGALRRGQG